MRERRDFRLAAYPYAAAASLSFKPPDRDARAPAFEFLRGGQPDPAVDRGDKDIRVS